MRKGVSLKVVMNLAGNEAIKKRWKTAWVFPSFSNTWYGRRETGFLRTLTFAQEKIMRKFFIICHEDTYPSSTLRAFLNIASELSSHFPLFT